MCRIGVGVQQTNGDTRDSEVHEMVHRLDHTLLVERRHDRPVISHAFRHFADEMKRHETRGLHPKKGIAIAVRDGLARDFDNVAEAGGHEQAEAFETMLEHGIGCCCCAVQDLV